MTLTLAKLVKAFFFRNQKVNPLKNNLIKSLTPPYDSSESDYDFDEAFQPLIIGSNMFLGDTW